MQEHVVQAAIRIDRIAEFSVATPRVSPTSPKQTAAAALRKRGVAMVDVQQQPATSTHDSAGVPQHGATVRSTLDHPEGAEKTDRSVRDMVAESVELDQIGLDR